MRSVLAAACLILLFGPPPAARGESAPPGADAATVGAGRLGARLAEALDVAGDNLFLSPASVSTALGLAAAGARGETAAQLADALAPGLTPEALPSAYAGLLESVATVADHDGITLSMANSLWPQQGHAILDGYLATARRDFRSEVRTLDFVGDAGGARETINAWVEDKTNDRIRNIIQPGVLGPMTRLVLVNAIYFLGDWRHPFDPAMTEEAEFTRADGSVTPAPLMRQTVRLPYAAGDGLQVVDIPYADGRLSMLVLLPARGAAPDPAALDPTRLTALTDALSPRVVVLSLPKFRIETMYELSEPLKDLGMSDAFAADTADFTGIDGPDSTLFIDAVIHKAFVDVDETGTEAAAATAVTMRVTSAMPEEEEPVVFRADRPFHFAIRDRQSGLILFLGKLADPAG